MENKTTEEMIATAIEPIMAQNVQLKAELDALKNNPVSNSGGMVFGLQNPKTETRTFGI